MVSWLAAWPLMLPLLQEPPPAGQGPLASRIEQVLRNLEQTLGDPLAGDVMWTSDLWELRAALLAADARLALVDRLLADTPKGEVDQAVSDLRGARAEGQRAIEAVLAEVQQLRLQVGMAALAGGREQLQRRLQDLSARATALSELS